MQYQSKLKKARYIRLARKRWKKRLARKKRKTAKTVTAKSQSIVLTAPVSMSFKHNYLETLRFLDEFRSTALPNSRVRAAVFVDLTKIESISIPVAIVLAAEFHRWSLVKNTRLKPRDIGNWNPKIIALFNNLGIFGLLNVEQQPVDADADSFTLSPLESGLKNDGKKIHSLQSRFQSELEDFTPAMPLYGGLMEAVENAVSHAYPDDYQPKHRYAGHRWWAASCLDFKTQRLRFFVFDQGAGIPFTLPRSGIWESIRQLTSEFSLRAQPRKEASALLNDHGFILERAFEVSRTQTMKEERGLGLEKMRKVVESGPKCGFRIISGFGEVSQSFNGKLEKLTHTHHIGGTLVEWSFPSNVFSVERMEKSNV